MYSNSMLILRILGNHRRLPDRGFCYLLRRCSDQIAVCGRRVADKVPEVVNQVGLVCVAEIKCKTCSVEGLAGVQAFDQLMQPIAADYPLRRNADVLLEEPLQRARAHARLRGELVDG